MAEQLRLDGEAASRGHLVVECDGGARGNPGPAAIGAVVVDETVDPPVIVAEISEAIGEATNNVAEYRALIAGLTAALEHEANTVEVRADSQLVVRQLEGRYRVRNEGLRPLFDEARSLMRRFERVDLKHVPRAENARADALVNAALDAGS